MSEKKLVNLEARMKAFAKETGDNLKKQRTSDGVRKRTSSLREARENVKTLYDVRTPTKTHLLLLSFNADAD